MTEQPRDVDPEQLERLRAIFSSAAATEPVVDEPIAPDRVWAAARGELGPEETAAIVDRLHRDPQLALEWRLARELSATADEPVVAPAANDRRYLTVGVLAAVAAAAALLIVVRDPKQDPSGVDPPPVVRSGAGEQALTTTVAEGAGVSREGFELRWSALEHTGRYELRVSTEALDPVYEALELDRAEAEVPGEALAGLGAGEVLIWQVTAVMDDGSRVSGPLWRVKLQ